MAVSERAARMALTAVTDGGDPAVAELVDGLGAQGALAKISEGALGDPLARRAARLDTDRLGRLARHYRARLVIPGDEEWPDGLDRLRFVQPIQRRGGVPIGLWLRGPGQLAERMALSVAIVGSRASTAYGNGIAVDLAAGLAEHGVTVVSGGAYGIDAASHRGALSEGGSTVAVLACGVDVPYPRGNAGLFERIAEGHLIVSELPPGEHPTRVRFLARNRLIAAMSKGTLVVEAALRSGARNTAGWAIECGRPVMAVPGPVSSAQSAAPHVMIRSGQATLITDASHVVELISPVGTAMASMSHGPERSTDEMSEVRLAVYEALPARARASVGEVALIAGVSIATCLSELAALEVIGMAEVSEEGWRIGRRTG